MLVSCHSSKTPSFLLTLDRGTAVPSSWILNNCPGLPRTLLVLGPKGPWPENSLSPRQTGMTGHPICQDGWLLPVTQLSPQMPFLRKAHLPAKLKWLPTSTRLTLHHITLFIFFQHSSLAGIILFLLFTFLLSNSPHSHISSLKTKVLPCYPGKAT